MILVQSFISLSLTRSKEKMAAVLSSQLGYRIEAKTVAFSFMGGLRLQGLNIFYDKKDAEPTISIGNARLTIKFFPLLLARISPHIRVDNARIVARKEPRGYSYQIITSDISKKISGDGESPKKGISLHAISVNIKKAEFIYPAIPNDSFRVEYRKIRIVLDKYNKLKLNTEIWLRCTMPKEGAMAKFINLYEINERLKCVLHGTLEGKDLNIGLISMAKKRDQIIGTGKIKDFTEANPNLDINFINSTIRLDNIVFLKKAFGAEGNISISAKFYGPMDNTKFIIRSQLENCFFKYKVRPDEVFAINNAGGIIESDGARAAIKSLTFYDANNLPYNITAEIGLSDEPEIQFGLYLPKNFFSAQNIPLDKLEANFKGTIKDALTGSLEIKAFYAKAGPGFNIAIDFKNIYFDYASPKAQHFKTDIVLIKNNAYLSQKLTLEGLAATIIKNKDEISIPDIVLTAYGAKLNGSAKADLSAKPHLTLSFKGTGLDVKKIMEDTQITDKLLSGDMDARIFFDNRKDTFLKGYCRIKNGAVDLNTLASAVKFPSLNLSGFYIMEAFFSCSNDLVKIRGVKLYSKDLMFNGFWDIGATLKGALNMAVSSKLLNQSPSFRKLLSIADINKPYIDFKFLLAGQPQALRFMWAKGEFKEKIESGLPGWIKRRIQKSLNESIDEVSE